MSGYSVDLRERVIQAWRNGKPQGWIAETFGVSVSSVKRYMKRFQETGSVVPTRQEREQPLIKVVQAAVVHAMVDEHPDATLETYCEDWEKRTGQRVSVPTMSRALQRFDRPRKKRPSAPPSGMKRPVRTGGR